MNRAVVCLLTAALLSCDGAFGQEAIAIREPVGGNVSVRPLVAGELRGFPPNVPVTVWVLVRPTATGDFWVQPRAHVAQGNQTWEATVYVGRPGTVDVGQRYEITAVANPPTPLREGDVLDKLPAGVRSSAVLVVRR